MAWTLDDIRRRLRTVLGLDEEAIETDVLDRYINSQLRYVLPLELDPPELRRIFSMDTVAGVYRYGLDSDMMSVIGPVYVDKRPIVLTYDQQWFFDYLYQIGTDTEDEDEPRYALVFNAELWLLPVPDDTYEIETIAIARPPKLENDSDEIFQNSWGLPVVYGAAIEYAYDIGDLETGSIVQGMYQEAISLARRASLYHQAYRRATPRF